MEGLIESISEESELILGAALDEFAELGLVESSIESIADRAKLDRAVRALFVDKAMVLANVRHDTDVLNLLLFTKTTLYIHADVIEFKE